MTNQPLQPPGIYQKLFAWFCKSDIYQELEGDLLEEFNLNASMHGLRKARQIYRKEVIRMIRPSVVARPKTIHQFLMSSLIQINFKLAVRNTLRHKAFSAINIFGLALALTISMFIANMLYTGYNFDTQHADLNRIYRITNTVTDAQNNKQAYASIPFRAAESIASDLSGLEATTHIKSGVSASFTLNQEKVSFSGIAVNRGFFDIFNFRVVAGNPLALFSDINSIIITENIAQRYFPGENAIGKQTSEGLIVKAVIESPRLKSHLKFDMISRLQPLTTGTDGHEYDWGHYLSDYAYVKLSENASPASLNDQLTGFSKSVNNLTGLDNVHYDFLSQPVKALIFKDSHFNNPGYVLGPEGVITYVIMIGVMLFIAGFNYTNLSVSRAIQRTKEIGIRKVSGSTKWQIISQILFETLILSFISLVVALVIYRAFSNDLLSIMPVLTNIFNPKLEPGIILLFTLFAAFTGLTAGIFPALFFAGISPLALFNPRVKTKKLSFLSVRKVLVAFQLTLSMFAVVFTILVQQQVNVLEDRPKGFETEKRIVLKSDTTSARLLKSAMLSVPGVESVTIASDVPGDLMHGAIRFFDPANGDSSLIAYALTVDDDFEQVVSPKLQAGKFFTPNRIETTEKEVLVNQEFLDLLGMSTSSGLGTVVRNNQLQYKIIGVLEPMISHAPFIGPTKPFVILRGKPRTNTMLIAEINQENLTSITPYMKDAWKDIYPEEEFSVQTLEAYLQAPVKEFDDLMAAQNFIAFAIIAIALLGQIGMAMYQAEIRVREISIRKVLGAGLLTIIRLLLKGTIIPLAIASLIACPLAYLIFQDSLAIMLSNPLQPHLGHFMVGIALLSLLVLSMVMSQTWSVARKNPVHALRSE